MNIASRRVHGGEVLGATPGHPLLTPALSGARDLSMSRQQAMLDLAAIQRIPGLAGYWPADPAYLFEDSAGTIPASVNGVVGCVRNVVAATVYTPVTVANPGFDADTDWTKGTGWTIADGVATKAAGTASVLSQAVSLVAGVAYVLTWTLTRTAGTLTPRFTGGTTNTGTGLALSGTYEENFVATAGNATLEFSADASFAGTVDNVTLVSVSNAPALQATTAVKPYLRRTPVSGVYWLDSNTLTSALTANLGNLGSACTVARAGAEGVTFIENVSITSTYNIAPAFGFNGDIAIFSRALTATEKALLTRYMQRGVPVLGTNLVTNGTFDTNTTGWESINASIASVDGRIIATNTTNGGSGFQQNIATNINSHYFARMRLLEETSTGSIFFNANTYPANAVIASTFATTAVTGNTLCLKASTALTKLQVSASSGTLAGETYTCDNISVRLIL